MTGTPIGKSGTRNGRVSPSHTVTWPRGVFAQETVIGVGQREPMATSYFPAAQRRYAQAMRGDLQLMKVDSGTLRGTFGDAPWLEPTQCPKRPADTLRAFDALLGADAAAISYEGSYAPSEEMRAWVSLVAPPLVYDAARARAEEPTEQGAHNRGKPQRLHQA